MVSGVSTYFMRAGALPTATESKVSSRKGSTTCRFRDAARRAKVPIDGDRNQRPGGNTVQFFKVFSGTTPRFVDRDGDRVSLELTGGGRLDGLVPLNGPPAQRAQFWILDPLASQSTLTGSVQKSAKGDGIAVIAEIIGLGKSEFSPFPRILRFV
jgi:hypothetical protein